MGDHSAIQWTDATWNPVAGCTRVSAGCDNCYAARLAATRMKHTRQYRGLATLTPSGRAAFNGTIRLLPERLDQPLRWRRPRRVFVNSLSDLFHEDVPDDYIDQVFAVMAKAAQHTFQVLSKRPERMREYFRPGVANRIERYAMRMQGWSPDVIDRVRALPLPNVQLGVSTEDQATADERIPLLLETPAAVRFISAEPLLGPIDLTRIRRDSRNVLGLNALSEDYPTDTLWRARLDWVIVGGESGPGARPMNIAWARDLVTQCRAAHAPVFVKQLGAHPFLHMAESCNIVTPGGSQIRAAGVEIDSSLDLDDAKGGDMAEWPEDLRVREMPAR